MTVGVLVGVGGNLQTSEGLYLTRVSQEARLALGCTLNVAIKCRLALAFTSSIEHIGWHTHSKTDWRGFMLKCFIDYRVVALLDCLVHIPCASNCFLCPIQMVDYQHSVSVCDLQDQIWLKASQLIREA